MPVKMIYDNELKRQKRTNFHHPKGLLTFPRRLPVFDRIKQHSRKLSKGIHGVSYIWEKDFCFVARSFWFLVAVAAIISCVVMYKSLLCQYKKQQIKTVVETSQMPIYKINFPAVALCPYYRVNWLRYKAAEEKFLPPGADANSKRIFYELMQIIDDIRLSKLNSLALLQNETVTRVVNKIPLDDLATFVAFRCDDLFVECFYDETKYDCCKIFVAEHTEKGICMVFNSMVSEESRKKQINDKFYPWKNRKAGEGTGLKFTVRYNTSYARNQSNHFFALDVMIKECEEWSESLTNLFLPDTKSYLAITPVLSETSESTKRFAPRKRKCLFADEKSNRYDRFEGLKFNKLNCIAKCQQNNWIKICNCSLSWFFPISGVVRKCTTSDFKCIYENKDVFTYIKSPLQDKFIKDSRRGVICDCIDSCYTFNFLTNLHANRMPIVNTSTRLIVGDIYIGQRVITKYETRLHSTMFDLIARFGGILGLCLGASLLGLVEVVYGALKVLVLLLVAMCTQKRKIKPDPKRKINKK